MPGGAVYSRIVKSNDEQRNRRAVSDVLNDFCLFFDMLNCRSAQVAPPTHSDRKLGETKSMLEKAHLF